MTNREPLLPRAWRETNGTRHSLAWWIAAVICGAAGAITGYFAASESPVAFATLGLFAGFFAPYVAAIVWGMAHAAAVPEEARDLRHAG